MTSPVLRLACAPGATPAKWARIWAERRPDVRLELVPVPAADAADAVRAGTVDLALLRLPTDTSGLGVIELYRETTVAVVPKEHHLAAADELRANDLDGEPTVLPLDDALAWADAPGAPIEHRPATTADAVELVAAGLGALIAPQSLARAHHRKDLTYRPITDAPESPVALCFPDGEQATDVAEFIGVVRGRRASSSRGAAEPAPKRTAREKTLAKQARRGDAKPVRKPKPKSTRRR